MDEELAEVVPLFGERKASSPESILVRVYEVAADGTKTLIRTERVATPERRMRLAS